MSSAKTAFKNTALFLYLIVLLSAITAAAEDDSLKILTEDYPILNYKKENGEITGVSTEIVRAIAQEAGERKCEIELCSWTKSFNETKEAKIPVALYSTTRIPEREQLFKWVGPIIKVRWQLCKLKTDQLKIKIRSLEDAKKIEKIGIYHNDAGEKILQHKGFSNLEPSKNPRDCFDELIKGKIPLLMTSDINIAAMTNEMDLELEVVLTVQEDSLYIAFSKATPDSIIERWQKALDTLKKEHRIDEIYKKWDVEAP